MIRADSAALKIAAETPRAGRGYCLERGGRCKCPRFDVSGAYSFGLFDLGA
jgi:hypothetical protein